MEGFELAAEEADHQVGFGRQGPPRERESEFGLFRKLPLQASVCAVVHPCAGCETQQRKYKTDWCSCQSFVPHATYQNQGITIPHPISRAPLTNAFAPMPSASGIGRPERRRKLYTQVLLFWTSAL